MIRLRHNVREYLNRCLQAKSLLHVRVILILTKIRCFVSWINEHGFFITLCLSLLGIIIAHFGYQVAIFQPLEEIAFKQQEYREKNLVKSYQKEMVNRHLKLANAFLYDEDIIAAIYQYQKALSLDKINPEAQMGLFIADIYQKQQQSSYKPGSIRRQILFIESEASKSQALRYLKPGALANVMMGNLNAWLDKKDISKKHFEKAKTIDPEASSAWFGLGLLHVYESPKKALEYYKTAVKLSPWNERYLNNLASLYGKLKQYDEAIKTYELILTLDKDYLLPYCEMAHIYTMNNNPDMAAAYLNSLVQLMNKPHMDMKKNQFPWQFSQDLILHTQKEKKYYAIKLFSGVLKKINQSYIASIPESVELKDIELVKLIDTFIRQLVR